MEQYETDKLFLMSKAMDIFENFIMESVVIFYMLSLEMIKNEIKNSLQNSNTYFWFDKQANAMMGHYITSDISSQELLENKVLVLDTIKKDIVIVLVEVGDRVYILGVKRKVLDGKYDGKYNDDIELMNQDVSVTVMTYKFHVEQTEKLYEY
eukprot:134364_1